MIVKEINLTNDKSLVMIVFIFLIYYVAMMKKVVYQHSRTSDSGMVEA